MARAGKKAAAGKDQAPVRQRQSVVIGVLAAIGLVVTAVLWFSGGSELPYCSAGSGCDVVQNSAWSRVAGVPLALLGFLAYAVLGGFALARPGRTGRALIAASALAGFIISVYLTIVSATIIKAYCIYCLVSLALMTLIAAATLVPAVFARGPGSLIGARAAGVLLGFALAGGMHIAATGEGGPGGPVDPDLRALASHLEARGAKFYGASWCPHCQQQKALFGAAARYLPYVECSPHGQRGPRATECETRDIRNYPTWIIDGRRIERVLPVAALKSLTGFDGEDRAAAAAP